VAHNVACGTCEWRATLLAEHVDGVRRCLQNMWMACDGACGTGGWRAVLLSTNLKIILSIKGGWRSQQMAGTRSLQQAL